MFTGIIETIGTVKKISPEGTNIHFSLSCDFLSELKVDQSLSHNGVCLTVTALNDEEYTVTAIQETLSKSNLATLKPGNKVNLERCMPANGRFDGHIVQGHVDQTAICKSVDDQSGSWIFRFDWEKRGEEVLVEKGSVCVNGVSLTCFDVDDKGFSVAIIPYTFEHTNFHEIQPGNVVNLEFDIIGKYIKKLVRQYV